MCWFQGKQTLLASGPGDGPTGPTYLKALAEFQNLLQGEERLCTVGPTVLDNYLKHITISKNPGTVEILTAFALAGDAAII